MLRVLVKLLLRPGAETDHVTVCQCLMFLDDAPKVAATLEELLDGTEVTPVASHVTENSQTYHF